MGRGSVKDITSLSVADDASRSLDFRASSTIRFGEHLFISGDTNFINEQHVGTVTISSDVKARWLQIIQDRQRRAASLSASFLFALAPDKQTVYRHILPQSYCHRQAAFLNESAYVVDPAAALAAVAKLYDVYPRTDSHWNHFGALVAANIILARYGLAMPDLDVRWVEQDRLGDLGYKVVPSETSTLVNSAIKSRCRLIYDNCVANNGRIRIWSKPAKMVARSPKKLLLMGDSFSYDLVHFLKESFDIVLHVHTFAMDYEICNVFRPDFVLCQITERFLWRLPEPQDGEALTALWRDKVRRDESLEKVPPYVEEDRTAYCEEAKWITDYATEAFAAFRVLLRIPD